MRRLALPLLLVAAEAVAGLSIEYGERPGELARCDRAAYRGKRAEANACYL